MCLPRFLIAGALALAACSSAKAPRPPGSGSATVPATATGSAATLTCKPGEIDHQGECYKECNSDDDCPEKSSCDQLHYIEDDGAKGPVTGMGCSK
jgi:hypothetical protein